MAYFYPCRTCRISTDECERHQSVKNAIAGLGIGSVKFKCAERKPLFSSGERVSFDWSHYDADYRDIYGQCDEDILTFTGTVASESSRPGHFVIRIDDCAVDSSIEGEFQPKDIFRNGGFCIRMAGAKLKRLNDPDKPICEHCLGYDKQERCVKSEFIFPMQCKFDGAE